MLWDVSNGVSRRGWAGGKNAQFYGEYLMTKNENLKITQANTVSPDVLGKIFD